MTQAMIAATLTIFIPLFLFLTWKIGLKETSIAFGVAGTVMVVVFLTLFFWDWYFT